MDTGSELRNPPSHHTLTAILNHSAAKHVGTTFSFSASQAALALKKLVDTILQNILKVTVSFREMTHDAWDKQLSAQFQLSLYSPSVQLRNRSRRFKDLDLGAMNNISATMNINQARAIQGHNRQALKLRLPIKLKKSEFATGRETI
jgi:hypothetical protein